MELGKLVVGKNEIWWLRAGSGGHGESPKPPDEVASSLPDNFSFVEDVDSRLGFRKPQLGALHAILANRSLEEREPITIVLPTGTGKTETMLAAYCVAPKKTLVIVPSDALREQISRKFATLGVLPEIGAVTGDFLCPSVLVLHSTLTDASQVDQAVSPANVIVATAQVLAGCSEVAKNSLAELCDVLFVDEAHHVAAKSWRAIKELFKSKEVVQFTATPYREDGQHIDSHVAYAYPLRLAQKHGYFARINYRAITDIVDPDRAVATAAVEQLRADLASGLDHLLLARVGSVARAKYIEKLYQELAPDLAPIRIDNQLALSTRIKRKNRLFDRSSKIVICVNMLGEGFDLPSLKVAAIHDPQKSLAVTLQFIGRFTRVGGATLGDASAFVPIQTRGIDERLRKLYGEDADWDKVIVELSDNEVSRTRDRSDFERSFGTLPQEVALRSIRPKMSTVAYWSQETLKWQPDEIYDLFEGRLLTKKLGINNRAKVAWWVSQEAIPVRWGEFASFHELVHHLYLVHLDQESGFLYINSSNNDSLHEDVAEAIGGSDVELLKGETVYRVLAKVNRRVPTNVGLLDVVNRNRRFSMHVGQDVLHAWSGEGGTKVKTNIFAHGYKDRKTVSFGASRKGRVWSHQIATDISDWVHWVKDIGPTITNNKISLESVLEGFLLPEAAIVRPPFVPIAIEWPHDLLKLMSESRQVGFGGEQYPLLETELRLKDHESDGPLTFDLLSPTWGLSYGFEFHSDKPPTIHALGRDGDAITTSGTEAISDFLTKHGLFVTFEREIVLDSNGLLYKPRRDAHLFPVDALEVIKWTGTNIRKESQGNERDTSSIQFKAIEVLRAEADWDVIIDDDGTGELADIVLLRMQDDVLEVLLVHCKYSSGDHPGARIGDLYEVCGQSLKMHRAKAMPELLTNVLLQREIKRQESGKNGLMVGRLDQLAAIANEAHFKTLRSTVAIVQPGLSKRRASASIRALLGGTERFLHETFGTPLRVLCSE